MELWFEITGVFLGCVGISLISFIHSLSNIGILFSSPAATPLLKRVAPYEMVAPFWIFALAAALQYRVLYNVFAPAYALLIAAMFAAYPFAVWMGWGLIQERGCYPRPGIQPGAGPRKPQISQRRG